MKIKPILREPARMNHSRLNAVLRQLRHYLATEPRGRNGGR